MGVFCCWLLTAPSSNSNEVINHLATLEGMSGSIDTMVPMQVLVDIDNSRNPMQLTKDRIERAATENQFMNGKIHAIDVSRCLCWWQACLRADAPNTQSYRRLLDDALVQNFPELGEHLMESSLHTAMQAGEPIKVEEEASNSLPNGV